MLTGVTKLTKLSVFSGLNHLTDISMDKRFATLLGFTPEEMDGTLRENVEAFGAKNGWDFATAKAKRYFLLFMKLIGADVSGERQSARGRADAILKDKSGVYVFEFKYGKTPQEALKQARTKDYAGPWLDAKPPVFLVGVNYDPKKRGIDDPLVEPL